MRFVVVVVVVAGINQPKYIYPTVLNKINLLFLSHWLSFKRSKENDLADTFVTRKKRNVNKIRRRLDPFRNFWPFHLLTNFYTSNN